MNKDKEHLKLLAIFHYVMAGLTAVCAIFPAIYLVIGMAIFASAGSHHGGGDPALAGGIIALIACVGLAGLLGVAALIGYSGLCLRDQKKRTLSLVVAGLLCLSVPLGTVLGVFTIVVLMRDSVAELYEGASNSEAEA